MSARKPLILVVEDDATIRKLVRMALELDGFEIAEAGDGLEALAALKHSPLPDLILLDLLMPRMNGYEFLEQLRTKHNGEPVSRIPVVVLSAVAKSASEKLVGARSVFQKPVDFEQLLRAIRDILSRNA